MPLCYQPQQSAPPWRGIHGAIIQLSCERGSSKTLKRGSSIQAVQTRELHQHVIFCFCGQLHAFAPHVPATAVGAPPWGGTHGDIIRTQLRATTANATTMPFYPSTPTTTVSEGGGDVVRLTNLPRELNSGLSLPFFGISASWSVILHSEKCTSNREGVGEYTGFSRL